MKNRSKPADESEGETLAAEENNHGYESVQAVCYGMGDGLEAVKKASSAEWNLVVSPAALETAKYLEKTFGTPYRIGYPLAQDMVRGRLSETDYAGKKILVVHQQVIANALRQELLAAGAAEVRVACWFMMKKELSEQGDISLKEEEDYISLVRGGGFDLVFADGCMQPMAPEQKLVDIPHFAVSGRIVE